MFYSDTLLSKTGPLARVWLASNMERKLSKKDCLSSNLEQSIEVMVDQGSAPMALRLSGQLLLGVVRIYSRKARYLLDDCNEALLKIKMAFRPGNVDLPADQSHAVNPASLTLPDALTEFDLLAPLPDPSMLFGDTLEVSRSRGQSVNLDWGTQSLITDTIERGLTEQYGLQDDDLGLDLGIDDFSLMDIEKGRDRIDREWNDEFDGGISKLADDDLGLDLRLDDDLDQLGAMPAGDLDMTDLQTFDLDNEAGAEIAAPAPRVRDTGSPLSDLRPSEERELETTFDKHVSLYEPQEEESVVGAPRLKRRRVIQMDNTLELRSAQIKEQQLDRSKILKAPSFLPRDPMLLALLNMQKSGGFVSSILGEGRTFGWAPELHDLLSIDIIRKTGNLKRKRDSGVADLSSDDENRLDIPQEESAVMSGGLLGEDSMRDESHVEELLDHAQPPMDDEDLSRLTPPVDFDETTMPLLHPADAGPISQGTQHAVHLLRRQFGPTGEASSSSRTKTSVLLQDLIPERTTTRRDATKMFFEVLVLATKDAVKVEQKTDAIGGAIRLRAKRGLWGAWAEEHSTQPARQETPEAAPAVAAAEA